MNKEEKRGGNMERLVSEKLERYEREEDELRFETFDNYTAWKVGNAIVEKAIKEELVIATSIRIGDFEVFKYGILGTNTENDGWMRRKVNTVNHLQISSIHAAAILEKENQTMEDYYSFNAEDYVCCGGGFPVKLKSGELIGTIAVSGLPDYEDHQVIVDVLTGFVK